MPDLPELPFEFPDMPDEPGKPADQAGEATDTDEPAASSARELVDAIDTLDHLLNQRGNSVQDTPATDDDDEADAALEIPLLLDVVRPDSGQASLLSSDTDEQGAFGLPDPAAGDPQATAGNASLQSQLIDELRQIIDDGLNRVAATTRFAVAQELQSQREDPPPPTESERRAALPSDMRTLAQSVDEALVRCGIDLGSHEALYGDLLAELNAILRGGLELIRRNMETTVRNRLQQHAEHTLRGLNELRADRQQELPWPAPDGDSAAVRPPTLEPYPDNGDNPGRSG